MTDRLKEEIELINAETRKKIRLIYSIEDELQLMRTAPSPEFEVYNAYVEDCLKWGRAQKNALFAN